MKKTKTKMLRVKPKDLSAAGMIKCALYDASTTVLILHEANSPLHRKKFHNPQEATREAIELLHGSIARAIKGIEIIEKKMQKIWHSYEENL